MLDDSADRPRPTALRWRVFALACGTSFLLYLHRYTWTIVGPKLQKDFHFSHTETGFLFSLFYYTYAGGQIPSGVVIDRFGPHRFLSVCIVAWSAAVAGIGQTVRLPLLGFWRLVFGLAQAGCYPALSTVTRNWFPQARRTVIQGWIATTFGRAGGALAPVILGTFLMGRCGWAWQTALGFLGLLGIAFGLLFGKVFRNTPVEHPGVNTAERELIERGSTSSASQARGTLSARAAWRNRSLRFFVLQQFLDAGSDTAFVWLIGTYFLQAHGFDIAKTGWLASLPLWGGALGGIAGGWLNDSCIAWSGSRRWSRSGVGCIGKVIGCALLALVVRQTSGVAAAWFLLAAKFFSDWSQPTVWGACTDLGGRSSATLFSIINTAGNLGAVVMPIVFGKVLDHFTVHTVAAGRVVLTTDWSQLFELLAAMYLGCAACWLMVDCTQTLEAKDPSQ